MGIKRFFRDVLLFMTLPLSLICYAQDSEDTEELNFEPIHTTIIAGSLNIEDSYTKNHSVGFSNDDIVLTIIKPDYKSNGFLKGVTITGLPAVNIPLPVNPRQDYEIEFNLTCPKFNKFSSIMLSVGNFTLNIGTKGYLIYSVNGDNMDILANNPKKWKLPLQEENDKISVKLERRNKILTFYANGSYLGEVNDSHNLLKEMSVILSLFSFKKNVSVYLNSIRVDQGGETED